MKPQSEISITLSWPVPTEKAGTEITKLVMRRPKTRHAKGLAIVIGPDVAKSLLAEDGKIGSQEIAENVITALMTADKLEALTLIVADLCGVEAKVIDDLDLIDLVAIGKAMLGFFPALQSIAPGSSAQTAPPSTGGNQAS